MQVGNTTLKKTVQDLGEFGAEALNTQVLYFTE
jgi:hypothetical protein